jgi:hypothetical protein
LIVCSACQRHHRSEEPSCPFCARRRARAIVAIAAASLVVGACGADGSQAASPQAPPDAPVVVVAPPEIEPSEDVVAEEVVADGAGDAIGPSDNDAEPDAVAEVEPGQPEFQRPVVMRYGVAPRPAPPPPKKP